VLFGACGLFAYLVSLGLFEIRSSLVLVLAAIGRLALGLAPAAVLARHFGWSSARFWRTTVLATPYPLELALFVYGQRFRLLPRDMVLALSGSTAFLIFITGVLLVSRWITVQTLPAAVREEQAEAIRRLGGLLLVLTAIGVVLVPVTWSLLFLHSVPEPVALIGYSAIAGCDFPRKHLMPNDLTKS